MERIISLSAVGSLKEEHRPLDFVIPDQFFDRTRGRVSTFFGDGLVAHISFADPVCPQLADVVAGAARAQASTSKQGGTYLCMEGPAFSTKAESNVYRSWGMDVIGMTNLQEAKLAREAEICYVTVAMVTDYDCWHPDHDAVTVRRIIVESHEERRERLQGCVAGGERRCPGDRMQMRLGSRPCDHHRPRQGARKHPEQASRSCKQVSLTTRAEWHGRLRFAHVPAIPLNESALPIRPLEVANQILSACLTGERPSPASIDELIAWAADADPVRAVEGSRALFGTLVEALSDRFDLALTDCYVRIFSHVIASLRPELDEIELAARYDCVRKPRRFAGAPDEVDDVFVLSRVTLGADVAITSLCLDAAKQCFPRARVWLAGGSKSWELFAGDARLSHLPVAYSRGGLLRERLAIADQMEPKFQRERSIVIDPDSRLSQLGLLPLCPVERYYFFESRSFGGDGERSLAELTRQWLCETFGAQDVKPYIAPKHPISAGDQPVIAVSFGVGENPAKRISDPFETALLRRLIRQDCRVVIDTGAGGEEAARVDAAVANCGGDPEQITKWQGSFAAFASIIAQSRLYVGYDSAGQHVAAACGVPLLTVFAGFPCSRMFARWQPAGPGPKEILRVDDSDPARVLDQATAALARLGF